MNAKHTGSWMVSADSHVTEPPECYSAFMDRKFREQAPRLVKSAAGGDVYVIDGMSGSVPLGIVAAAGKNPRDMRLDQATFAELHPGGWDPKERLLAQDRDGIACEVIYPSVGLVLCNHTDPHFTRACFQAYNRWLEEFVSEAPERLIGIGQCAVMSVESAIADFKDIKALGLSGVMLPGQPFTDFDYDDPAFDPLWETAIDLDLPISFHILTSARGRNSMQELTTARSLRQNFVDGPIRANQDIIYLFIWGRIFERNPDLKLVCVEADAGWAPYFTYKLDQHYDRRRFWLNIPDMARKPSEFFWNNVFLTFQDDYTAFTSPGQVKANNLLWANDFPHSDSTWPNSAATFASLSKSLSKADQQAIFRENTLRLYRGDLVAPSGNNGPD